MDREQSALLAAWLSFGVSLLTLVVTGVGLTVAGIALLSIDQVKWVVCRNFGYECGFQRIQAYLLTLDVDPTPAPPNQVGANVPPPGIVGPDYYAMPSSAWDLLVAGVYPPTLDDLTGILMPATPVDTPLPADTRCLSLMSLRSELARGVPDYALVGDRWRWKVNFLTNPVDEGVIPPGSDPHPRSIAFEIDASYAALPHAVALQVHVNAYKSDVLGMNVFPVVARDYTMSLPAGSSGITFLCPLPDLQPGRYGLFFETNGEVGDWQQKIGPLDLSVRSFTPPKPGSGAAAP